MQQIVATNIGKKIKLGYQRRRMKMMKTRMTTTTTTTLTTTTLTVAAMKMPTKTTSTKTTITTLFKRTTQTNTRTKTTTRTTTRQSATSTWRHQFFVKIIHQKMMGPIPVAFAIFLTTRTLPKYANGRQAQSIFKEQVPIQQ
jgi:hypothetical protein